VLFCLRDILLQFISKLLISVSQLPLVVLDQQFERSGSVAAALRTRVGRNSYNSDAVQLPEVVVLVLLRDSPGNEISRGL